MNTKITKYKPEQHTLGARFPLVVVPGENLLVLGLPLSLGPKRSILITVKAKYVNVMLVALTL